MFVRRWGWSRSRPSPFPLPHSGMNEPCASPRKRKTKGPKKNKQSRQTRSSRPRTTSRLRLLTPPAKESTAANLEVAWKLCVRRRPAPNWRLLVRGFATMTMASNAHPDPAVAAHAAKPPKLHGRAFYESIGSPKFVVAPMVDQSEFVRSFSPSSAVHHHAAPLTSMRQSSRRPGVCSLVPS